MNNEDIELPAEFQSGNEVPVDQAMIKRERMIEILNAAIEAERVHCEQAELAVAQLYLTLTDAMGYESESGLSPEEWAARLLLSYMEKEQ